MFNSHKMFGRRQSAAHPPGSMFGSWAPIPSLPVIDYEIVKNIVVEEIQFAITDIINTLQTTLQQFVSNLTQFITFANNTITLNAGIVTAPGKLFCKYMTCEGIQCNVIGNGIGNGDPNSPPIRVEQNVVMESGYTLTLYQADIIVRGGYIDTVYASDIIMDGAISIRNNQYLLTASLSNEGEIICKTFRTNTMTLNPNGGIYYTQNNQPVSIQEVIKEYLKTYYLSRANTSIGTVTSVEYGNTPSATLTYDDATNETKFNFVLVTGPQGPSGTNGTNGINGTNGASGVDGHTPTFAIGTVKAVTTDPKVTLRADPAVPYNFFLDFELKTGPQGATGAQGERGERGPAGNDGKDGKDGADGADGSGGGGAGDLINTIIATVGAAFGIVSIGSLITYVTNLSAALTALSVRVDFLEAGLTYVARLWTIVKNDARVILRAPSVIANCSQGFYVNYNDAENPLEIHEIARFQPSGTVFNELVELRGPTTFKTSTVKFDKGIRLPVTFKTPAVNDASTLNDILSISETSAIELKGTYYQSGSTQFGPTYTYQNPSFKITGYDTFIGIEKTFFQVSSSGVVSANAYASILLPNGGTLTIKHPNNLYTVFDVNSLGEVKCTGLTIRNSTGQTTNYGISTTGNLTANNITATSFTVDSFNPASMNLGTGAANTITCGGLTVGTGNYGISNTGVLSASNLALSSLNVGTGAGNTVTCGALTVGSNYGLTNAGVITGSSLSIGSNYGITNAGALTVNSLSVPSLYLGVAATNVLTCGKINITNNYYIDELGEFKGAKVTTGSVTTSKINHDTSKDFILVEDSTKDIIINERARGGNILLNRNGDSTSNVIISTGRLGIGTGTPTKALEVQGGIHASTQISTIDQFQVLDTNKVLQSKLVANSLEFTSNDATIKFGSAGNITQNSLKPRFIKSPAMDVYTANYYYNITYNYQAYTTIFINTIPQTRKNNIVRINNNANIPGGHIVHIFMDVSVGSYYIEPNSKGYIYYRATMGAQTQKITDNLFLTQDCIATYLGNDEWYFKVLY